MERSGVDILAQGAKRFGLVLAAGIPALVLLLLWVSLASAAGRIEPIDEVFEPSVAKDPSTHAKVAVVQWAPSEDAPIVVSPAEAESYKQRNREALALRIREAAAAGAEWVVTPEFGVVGYPDIPDLPSEDDNFQNRRQAAPYAESVPGPSTRFFGRLARELGVVIHFGTMERDARTGLFHNTVAAIGADGELLARYRKMHLFTGEEKYLVPGVRPVTYRGPFGKVGIIICSDVYSARPMEDYRLRQVEVLALSTSWAQLNTGMVYFRRGARRVGAYLLAANHTYFPDSGVINPDGTPQSHIRQSEGIAYGYVPRAAQPAGGGVETGRTRGSAAVK